MTIKEGVETAKVGRAAKSLAGKPCTERKTPEKVLTGGSLEDHKNKAIAIAKIPPKALPASSQTDVQDSSRGPKKAAKIYSGSVKVDTTVVSKDGVSKQVPHYLRASTSSCHDACKYGIKSNLDGSDASNKTRERSKTLTKMVQADLKPAASKAPRTPKSIANSRSPIGSSTKVSSKAKIRIVKADSEPKLVNSSPSNSRHVASKPILENKSKAANTSGTAPTRSLNFAIQGHANAKADTPLHHKKLSFKVKVNSARRPEKKHEVKSHSPKSMSPSVPFNPQEERPNAVVPFNLPEERPSAVGTHEVCSRDQSESDANSQIYDNEGKETQCYEHSESAGESDCEKHDRAFLQQASKGEHHSIKANCYDGDTASSSAGHESIECDDEKNRDSIKPNCYDGDMASSSAGHDSIECDDEKNRDSIKPNCYDGDMASSSAGHDSIECDDEKNRDFESYVENFVIQNDLDQDLDGVCSEEYSEYSESARSGSYDEEVESCNVKKENQMICGEESNCGLERRRFRRVRSIRRSGNSNPQPENVVLRHQDVQGRKASEEWMLNHVIEEAVNKLAHTRKSKVKTLVGAFESVISLTESETHDSKQVATKDLSQMGPLQECT